MIGMALAALALLLSGVLMGLGVGHLAMTRGPVSDGPMNLALAVASGLVMIAGVVVGGYLRMRQ